jgi:hypothetical protein
MMESTPRLGMPLLAVGQAAKELAHNESLQVLDSIVAAAVEQPPLNDPPSSPTIGSCYIVGESPTGSWAGNAGCLATFASGGWVFYSPRDGVSAYVRATATWIVYRAGAWELGQLRGSALLIGGQQVVGPQASAIATPSGGAVVDVEARAALVATLSALRQHGLIAT